MNDFIFLVCLLIIIIWICLIFIILPILYKYDNNENESCHFFRKSKTRKDRLRHRNPHDRYTRVRYTRVHFTCYTAWPDDKPRVYGAVVYPLVFAENCETRDDSVPGIRAMNFARVRWEEAKGKRVTERGSKGIVLPAPIHRCD